MTTIQDPPAEAALPAPAVAVATGAAPRRKDSGADAELGRRSWWGAASPLRTRSASSCSRRSRSSRRSS